jgi:TolB-like protein
VRRQCVFTVFVLIASGAVFFLATAAHAGQSGGVFTSSITETEMKNIPLRSYGLDRPKSIASIAILPLENLSDNPLAAKMVRDNIKKEFVGKGLFAIALSKDVNRFLARRRIRYTGAITRVAVREMGKVLGVDAVLLGTINYYSVVGDTLIVGLNCRMLSAVDGRIIWAENVTYTGKDFEGVLGLGSVKSLETLASMVVKDLVEDLRERFFVRDSVHGPFEIERVITYPVMGKSGGKRDINVRFLNLDGTPRIVKAIVGNQEYILSRVSAGEYKGVVDAPDMEGTHLLDVVAITSRREPYVFSAAGKVIVDDTPPVVTMSSSRKVFSSKKSDFVVFEPRLLSLEEIDEWSVKITNSEGVVVRSDRGYGRVPARLRWKGENTAQSRVVEGSYTFSLTVKDPSGNAANVSNVVMVKNTPPAIDVDVEIVEDTVLFSFNYSPDEPIDSWKIAIVERSGNVVKMVSGKGRTLPERFEYPMGTDYDIKKLSFTVEAKDVAGNEFVMTKTIPSLFAQKVPFAGLKGMKNVLWEDF